MKMNSGRKRRVLIVEDDEAHGRMLAEELHEGGYEVQVVPSAEEGLRQNQEWSPELILSDLQLPGADGIDLLRQLQEEPLPPAVVILTAFGTIPQAVEALKAGADNFLTKPIDFDHLHIAVDRGCQVRDLKKRLWEFQNHEGSDTSFHGLYGTSAPMRRLIEKIQVVARMDGPIIILGESGVGKELVAKAVHAESGKRSKPFVPVNCASIPENLLESEFFGHTAGAFTGAARHRRGLFAEANGGTLFLDEVNELPLPMQAKLLRALQEGKIREVGSSRETEVDVRVVVATNADLEKEVEEGRFRQDLFYRLEMFQLEVPPLRLRGGDIELLAARFLSQAREEVGREIEGFSAAALDLLRSYPFPGNVREMQNAIKRAAAFCREGIIEPEDLPDRIRKHERSTGDAASGRGGTLLLQDGEALPSLEEMKTRYILHALGVAGGNKRKAAELLGIGRRTLYRYIGNDT